MKATVMCVMVAVGCPDLKKPSNGWLKRNTNQMTAGCVASEVTWTLDCVGTEWHGATFNCSLGLSVSHTFSSFALFTSYNLNFRHKKMLNVKKSFRVPSHCRGCYTRAWFHT